MSKSFRLLLSGAFALLALLGCLVYGDAVRSEMEASREETLQKYGGEVTTIVVAARDLEVGDRVTSLSCEERDWVADLVPEGAVTSLEETEGSALTSPISKGTPLTQAALRDSSETLDIPSGMAAYTLSVNDSIGILRSVPLGTTLIAYQMDDALTHLISSDVTVIGRDPDGGNTITVAVPFEEISEFIQAVSDRSLRLIQPSNSLADLDRDPAAEVDGGDGGADVPPEGTAPEAAPDLPAEDVPAEVPAEPVEPEPEVGAEVVEGTVPEEGAEPMDGAAADEGEVW